MSTRSGTRFLDIPPVQLKVIYWGPAEVGKTTSLLAVQRRLANHVVDGLVAVQTTEGRTLWNEYIPVRFDIPRDGSVLSVLVHLVSTTGQERFLNTREHVMGRADGIIFVADCRPGGIAATRRSYEEMLAFMHEETRLVVQANWQDIPGALTASRLEGLLESWHPVSLRRRPRAMEVIPTIASRGTRCVEAFITLMIGMLSPR